MKKSLFKSLKSCFLSPSSSSAPSNPNPNPKEEDTKSSSHSTTLASASDTATFTTSELTALHHWSLYGQPGAPPLKRTLLTDWKTRPFEKPVSGSWGAGGLKLGSEEVRALVMGFKPREMEDKWFVYCEDLNDDVGDIGKGGEMERRLRVCMCRSWTGKRIVEVEILVWRMREDDVEKEKRGTGDWEGKIIGLTWDDIYDGRTKEECEENAKSRVREVCRWVLGVKLSDDE